MRNKLGYLAVLASAVFFATASIIIKYAYFLGLGPWDIITTQSLIASIILGLILLARPGYRRLPDRIRLVHLMFQGIIGSLVTTILFFFALQTIDASLATVLLYVYPGFVTLGSVLFLRERLFLSHYLALVLALGGTVLTLNITSAHWENLSQSGILLALGAAVSYAFYNLYGQYNLEAMDPFLVTAYTQFFSTIGLVIFRPPFALLSAINPPVIMVGALLAVFTSIVPFFLLLKGISLVGAGKAAIVSIFELPVALILAATILGETITIPQLIGALLILISITFLNNRGITTLPPKAGEHAK